MPDQIQNATEVYEPCAQCGDLKTRNARLCPHCGAGSLPGSRAAAVGVTVARVLLAMGIGLLALPLGLLGACGVLAGGLGVGIWALLLGLLGLALSAGGILLMILLLGGFQKDTGGR